MKRVRAARSGDRPAARARTPRKRDHAARRPRQRLGQLLLERGVITEDQLAHALSEKGEFGRETRPASWSALA